ncbi:MAG: hypothetical protein V1685_02985 [Parcubacteria group bacterium]
MSKQTDPVIAEMRRILAVAPEGGRGRQAQRAAITPSKRLVAHIGRQDRSTWPSIYGQIIQMIAEYFADGGPYSPVFKKLGELLAEQAFEAKDLDLIGECFLWEGEGEVELHRARARGILTMGFFRFLGNFVHHSLTFCQLAFDHHAALQEKVLRDGRSRMEEKPASHLGSPLLRVVYYSLSCSVSDHTPQKRWFENVVRAAAGGNQSAKASLQGILEIVRFVWGDVPVLDTEATGTENPVEDSTLCYDDDFLTKPMRIVVHDDLVAVVEKYLARLRETSDDLGKSAHSFTEWFISHIPELAASFDRKCTEITERPRYGLRPFGFDSVLIEVSILQYYAMSSFAFYPEGEQFPNVKLQLNLLTFGKRINQLWAYVRDFSLELKREGLEIQYGSSMPFIRVVLEYVVVDALHRIICREPKQNLADEKVTREAASGTEPKKSVTVRPFLRRLPVGYRASDDARQQAFLQMGWELPEGVTFVQSHERWVGLPAEKPAPLFRYTDETIIQSIQE